MQIEQERFNRQQIPIKMGSAGTGCNRRIRAAAGLDGFGGGGLDGSAASSRPDREQAALRGSEYDRTSSEGKYRSCSTSASGSGSSSDEEHEPQELKGFPSRRIRYVELARPVCRHTPIADEKERKKETKEIPYRMGVAEDIIGPCGV